LQDLEQELLIMTHRWGLHNGTAGRQSVLGQLANLQHNFAPTRLIDISFNALVGLWFATEDLRDFDDRAAGADEVDGRLFAVEVSGRLINEQDILRAWEDTTDNPWRGLRAARREGDAISKHEWTTKTYAWRPPRLNERIAAQAGGFLLGGVPTTGTPKVPFQIPSSGANGSQTWAISDVRRAMSVPLHLHKLGATRGSRSDHPVYTIRITGTAKSEIRTILEQSFGINAAGLYPDFSGLGRYAFAGQLPGRPPQPSSGKASARRVPISRIARRLSARSRSTPS
jgi:FRG domain